MVTNLSIFDLHEGTVTAGGQVTIVTDLKTTRWASVWDCFRAALRQLFGFCPQERFHFTSVLPPALGRASHRAPDQPTAHRIAGEQLQ
jgi:hypothetical protein